uniref:CTP synthase (glutamine hydrolyzing) n=1 Tax=Arundo donax TaxID=35708 RepID=A0A0A9E139_ARUDO
MVLAAKYARENKVPYLGICLGMQISVIEMSRHVLGLGDADSEEFNKDTPNRVVMYMPEVSKTHMGNTMRLGCRRTFFRKPDCLTSKLNLKCLDSCVVWSFPYWDVYIFVASQFKMQL